MPTFAEVLRETRQKAGATLGMLGKAIGVSAAFMSDVETGRRPALSDGRILAVAAILGVEAKPLLAAAAADRRYVRLDAESVEQQRAGAALAETWRDLNDEELEELSAYLAKWRKKHQAGIVATAKMLQNAADGKSVLWFDVYHCSETPVTSRQYTDGFQPTPWRCPACRETVEDDELRYDLIEKVKSVKS